MLHRSLRGVALACALVAQGGAAAAQSAGEVLFRPCATCHMIGEGAGHHVGPHLNGLLGRPIGGTAGYDYSEELVEAGAEGQIWSETTLDRFLAGPEGYFPNTYMVFRGIGSAEDRATLIAYILETGGPVGADLTTFDAYIDPEILAVLEIEGDVPYGAYLSSECTACHRASGGEGIPSVAGLAPSVFIAALVDYRNGTREHQVMNTLAQRLGDEEIAALAAYFETAE